MDQEKKDRRTKKTRQLLRASLLALLKEKRYDEISVQDIIAQADVSRSTFYMHYADKDDLLTGGHGVFAENLDHQMTAHPEADGASAFSARIWFYHVQAQGGVLKIIAKDPAMELAMKTLRAIIRRNVQERMQAHGQTGPEGMPMPLIVDFVADSLMTLITWWVKGGMEHTPEQMDDMFQQLVLPGVSSVLNARSGS